MASPTPWTWVWVNSGSWWWSGRPGVLQFMGSQKVRHDWATELNDQKDVRMLFLALSWYFWHSDEWKTVLTKLMVTLGRLWSLPAPLSGLLVGEPRGQRQGVLWSQWAPTLTTYKTLHGFKGRVVSSRLSAEWRCASHTVVGGSSKILHLPPWEQPWCVVGTRTC